MSEWTAEAQRAIELSEQWMVDVAEQIPCKVYLFGSAIYQDGTQFDSVRSDLDILLVLNETGSAISRLDLLVKLKNLKLSLELKMIPALSRNVCDEPGASIVVATPFELGANIHKSGARRFFDRNAYLELAAKDDVKIGLEGAGRMEVSDELRQAIELVQKTRNRFLSVAANGAGGIPDHVSHDPLPKELMRAAAQIVEDAEDGQWYDTRLGLESLHQMLVNERIKDRRVAKLFDSKISVLRGGRGRANVKLSDEDQLLLAELFFDQCYSLFQTKALSDKHPLDSTVMHGSDVRHLGSSEGVPLPGIDDDGCSNGSNDAATDSARIYKLADQLSNWTPNVSDDDESLWISNIVSYLGNTIEEFRLGLDGYGIPVFTSIPSINLNKRFDIVVYLRTSDGRSEILPIEVTRFRGFSHLASTLLGLPKTQHLIVLVVYGIPEARELRAKDEIAEFERNNDNVRIIPFTSRGARRAVT